MKKKENKILQVIFFKIYKKETKTNFLFLFIRSRFGRVHFLPVNSKLTIHEHIKVFPLDLFDYINIFLDQKFRKILIQILKA